MLQLRVIVNVMAGRYRNCDGASAIQPFELTKKIDIQAR
jgi:hypothetical protein